MELDSLHLVIEENTQPTDYEQDENLIFFAFGEKFNKMVNFWRQKSTKWLLR